MKLLVVVDMNNDFIDGSLGTKEAQSIVPSVVSKIEEYKQNKDTIIITQDTHNKNYLQTSEGKKLPIEHCIYGTLGWEINNEVNSALNGYHHVDILKGTFGTKKLEETIKKIIRNKHCNFEEIEVVGLCTDICVITNVLLLKTAFPDIKITVDSSCCAGVTPEKHEAALEVMRSCQVDVI